MTLVEALWFCCDMFPDSGSCDVYNRHVHWISLTQAMCFLSEFNSSFDEYSSELKSGRLEWSPVHKSEKFWRENAVRLNEKNYELLK